LISLEDPQKKSFKMPNGTEILPEFKDLQKVDVLFQTYDLGLGSIVNRNFEIKVLHKNSKSIKKCDLGLLFQKNTKTSSECYEIEIFQFSDDIYLESFEANELLTEINTRRQNAYYFTNRDQDEKAEFEKTSNLINRVQKHKNWFLKKVLSLLGKL
jgi:hypothetical protein